MSDVGRLFGISLPSGLMPGFNVAPMQLILGLRLAEGHREAALFK